MLPAHLRRSVWLTAIGAMLALSACGGQPGAAAPDDNAGGGDAGGNQGGNGGGGGELCSIVSEGEIGQIAGGSVTTTELTDTDCSYTLDETELVNVRYESSYDPNLETARLICDDAEDVSGVGDMALWCPGLNVLYFNKGSSSLAVQLVYVMDEPSRPEKDIATDIARRIADGL